MPAGTPTTGTAFAQLSVGDILIFGVDWIQRIFKIVSKWASVHFFKKKKSFCSVNSFD